MFFVPSVGRAVMSSILYFPFNHVGNVDWVCLDHDSNSEHGTAIVHYILQKKSYSLFRTAFCIRDFICCNDIYLYKAAITSFYATWNGSNSVQFHVMSEHNCHYCVAFTEQRWFAERRVKWGDPCTDGRGEWCNRGR
jgi:hypothetical protein